MKDTVTRRTRETKAGRRLAVEAEVAQLCPTLRPHGLFSPWDSPGENVGVSSLSLLQGIFQTQGSNPGLLHSRQITYQLSHQGMSVFDKVLGEGQSGSKVVFE